MRRFLILGDKCTSHNQLQIYLFKSTLGRHRKLAKLCRENFSADFIHVNPSMPTEEQTPRNFYRGYDRGFASIASNFDASRRVSNDLILQLIDDEAESGVKFYLVRGAAGTGKTVVLKRIAWEIAKEFECARALVS